MTKTYLEFTFFKVILRFGILNFGHWDLFVICYLGFVICTSHKLPPLLRKNKHELNSNSSIPQFEIRNSKFEIFPPCTVNSSQKFHGQ